MTLSQALQDAHAYYSGFLGYEGPDLWDRISEDGEVQRDISDRAEEMRGDEISHLQDELEAANDIRVSEAVHDALIEVAEFLADGDSPLYAEFCNTFGVRP